MIKWLGRILAVLFACLASASFTLAVGTTALQNALSSPDTLKAAFRNQDVYRQLLPIAIPTILEASDVEAASMVRLSDVIQSLTPEVWQNIMRDLLPSNLLQSQVESWIDALYQIWGGNRTILNESISLEDIANQLNTASNDAARAVLDNAPTCTTDQERAIQNIGAGTNGVLPICRPTDENLYNISQTTIENTLKGVAEQFGSGEITWGDFFRIDDTSARVTQLVFQIAGQVSLLFYLLPLAFLCLIVFVTVRSLKSFGRWAGATAFMSAIAILFLIFVLQAAVISAFTEAVVGTSEIERYGSQFFAGLMRSIFSEMAGMLLLFIGIFIVIGFALLFISMLARQPDELLARGSVLITSDGQIISTASQKRSRNN